MRIQVITDRKSDAELIHEFYGINPNMITDYYPEIVKSGDIDILLDKKYTAGSNLYVTKKYLNDQLGKLAEIADVIAEILNYQWPDSTVITVQPAVCPIAPRFIEESHFLVPYFFSHDEIIRICAHEMTHFAYFAKLQASVGKVDTESPSQDWLISEIVAPIVVNSDRLQSILHNKESFFLSGVDNSVIQKLANLYHQYDYDDIVGYRTAALKLLNETC